ncbi:MAG TPA: hypothetical protein VGC79_06830 [Polyangiaceae bacterium]
MYKRAFAALLLSFGSSLAFSSASCGPTCPAGQQSCGNSNAGNVDAGSPASCEVLTAMRSCMDKFCKQASNPFCTCYTRGYTLTIDGCTCVDFDTKKFCANAEANGLDADSYDCAADSSAISSYCVPVN